MSDISPPSGLDPKLKFSSTLGEVIINVDEAVRMMMETDTPQAKALYRLFRKHYAKWRIMPELKPEKQRENALFDAFAEAGINTVDHGEINETMDPA